MDYIFTTLGNLVHQTAFFNLTVGNFIMIFVACFFLYLAIGRGYEPLLLCRSHLVCFWSICIRIS